MFTIIILVLDWNPLDFSLIAPVGISKMTQNFVPFTNGGDGGGQGGGMQRRHASRIALLENVDNGIDTGSLALMTE